MSEPILSRACVGWQSPALEEWVLTRCPALPQTSHKAFSPKLSRWQNRVSVLRHVRAHTAMQKLRIEREGLARATENGPSNDGQIPKSEWMHKQSPTEISNYTIRFDFASL